MELSVCKLWPNSDVAMTFAGDLCNVKQLGEAKGSLVEITVETGRETQQD
jgi:hypothetical protein